MLNPEMVAAVFVIGGVGAAASYVVYRALDAAGPELQPGDLLPAPPWEGPPLPRFMLRSPEITTRALQAVQLGFPKGEL